MGRAARAGRRGRMGAATCWALCALTGLLCYPRAAHAAPPLGLDAGVELAAGRLEAPRDTQWLLSPRLWASYRLWHDLHLDLQWGAAMLRTTGEDGSSVTLGVPGNPWLRGRYVFAPADGVAVEASLGATAPAAFIGNGARTGQRRSALAFASGVRGMRDAWIWAPGQTAIVAGAAVQNAPLRHMSLRLEGDLATTFNAGSSATRRITHLLGQVAIEVGGLLGRWKPALRVQTIVFDLQQDYAQTSLSPRLRVALPSVTLETFVTWNVDAPLGTAGTGLDVWGLGVAGEGRF